jgi:hypothetical protein
MAYGDASRRRPEPPKPPPDAGPLLEAAQRHLENAGVSACLVRSAAGDLLVAIGSPSDKLFAMLASHMPAQGGAGD